MGEEMGKANKVELGIFPGAAEAVKDLAKPVYDDVLKRGAIQAGKTVETVMRLVNAMLMPLNVLIYGIEEIEPMLKEGVSKRLLAWGTKDEDMRTPPAYLVVPAVEALRYTASVDELREMFLNLIAASMDAQRSATVHPSFVEIIKQLDPDEGRILTLFIRNKALQHWSFEAKRHRMPEGKAGYYESGPTFVRLSLMAKDAGCVAPQRVPAYIDNLLRLGLVYEPAPWPSHAESVQSLRDPRQDKENPQFFHSGKRISELVDFFPELEEVAASFEQDNYMANHFDIWISELRLTEYGKAFCLSCVASEDPDGLLAFGAGDEHLYRNRIRV